NYTGATDIKTGELWIGTGGSLNSASRVNLGLTDTNVAKFYLTGGVTNSNNITVLSTNTAGSKVLGGLSSSGTNTFAGNVTNNNSGGVWLENTVAGGTVAFTGVLSGTGSVTVGGLGSVQLGNTNNTFSGNITVLTNAVLAGSVWTTNAANAFSSFGNHLATSNSASAQWLTLNGGTARYTGAGETNNMGFSVGTGGGTIDSSGNGNIQFKWGSGAVRLVGDQTTARTITFSGTNAGAMSTSGYNQFNGRITNGSGGAVVTVVKTGTGNWGFTYSSGSGYTGGLEIRQGSIVVQSGDLDWNAINAGSALGGGDVKIFDGAGLSSLSSTVRVATTNNTFKLGGTNFLAYVELPKVLLTNNTIVNNGTNVFPTGGIAYSPATANFNTILGSTNGVGELGGSYSLTKIGGGVLTLNGANSYSGGTIMSNGVLYVTNTGTLGSASSAVTLAGGILDLGNATRTNGTVTVSGGTLTNGTVSATTINISGGTLTGAGLTASSAFNYGGGATGLASAVLGGAGRFYLTNSTLTLSDNFNTLTGGIGLTGGTLTLTNASNLGSGSFLLGSAGTLGTLQVNTTTSATNGFVVNDSSTNTSINVASGQTFTMSGTISQ
ncbi:MAG: hypothetical protein EBU36_03755, partial [Verrucomicrobia bacterium]|nr:hypothetical protein [Verrucomicrobiota bacterium]